MRKIDSDSFNKVVLEQIYKIKDIVMNKISIDNVQYFDSSILESARNTLAYYEDKTLEYGKDVNVNSVELDKLDKMLRYLKLRKKRTSVVKRDLIYSSNYVTESDDGPVFKTRIKPPNEYDGRQSFFRITQGQYPGLESDIDVSPGNYGTSSTRMFSTWINNDGQRYEYNVTRNKREVIVTVRPNNDTSGFVDEKDLFYRILGVFWRLV